MPVERVNKLSSLVPEELGISLDEALERAPSSSRPSIRIREIRELLDLRGGSKDWRGTSARTRRPW
jgi:hypothetical protein